MSGGVGGWESRGSHLSRLARSMKIYIFAVIFLALCFAPLTSPLADTRLPGYSGCYELTLTPMAPTDKNTELVRTTLPNKFRLIEEKKPGYKTVYTVIPSRSGARLSGSWLLRDDGGIRIQWGDGYGFAVIELGPRGDNLEGQAGYWSDDGGHDTWTDKASAKKIACDDSLKSELTNQGSALNLPPKSRHLR